MNAIRSHFFLSFLLSFVATFGFLTVSIAAPNASSKNNQTPQTQTQKKSEIVATSVTSAVIDTETLVVKNYYEDLLAKRYSRELSSSLDRQNFSLSVQVDLKKIQKNDASGADDVPLDLSFGVASEAGVDESGSSVFGKNYEIKQVSVLLGVKDGVSITDKTQAEEWLKKRVELEFGGNAQVISTALKNLSDPDKKNGFFTVLNQLQGLIGQIILALALLSAVFLGKVLFKKGTAANERSATPNSPANVFSNSVGGSGGRSHEEVEVKHEEGDKAQFFSEEVSKESDKIRAVLPKIQNEIENIIRTWCQAGELGRLKLACFSESVGYELGKLPIPVDAHADVVRTFEKMSYQNNKEKLELLKKIHWDLLMAFNLGNDALEQPFSYLNGVSVDSLNEILIDKNVKLKTLVSLYMPDELRAHYFKNLEGDSKLELLRMAAEMSEVQNSEVKELDTSLKELMRPKKGGNALQMDFAMVKLISSLSPIEELTLLTSLSGKSIESFKRHVPTLAFIDQWPDDKLSLLLSRCIPDEVVVLLRIRPDMTDRVISVCPPMVAEVANDELTREDRLDNTGKNELLISFKNRIYEMVQYKEVFLEEIFKEQKSGLKLVKQQVTSENPIEEDQKDVA